MGTAGWDKLLMNKTLIVFNGTELLGSVVVDLFIADSGSLGMTVEKAPVKDETSSPGIRIVGNNILVGNENPSIDILVDADLKVCSF